MTGRSGFKWNWGSKRNGPSGEAGERVNGNAWRDASGVD